MSDVNDVEVLRPNLVDIIRPHKRNSIIIFISRQVTKLPNEIITRPRIKAYLSIAKFLPWTPEKVECKVFGQRTVKGSLTMHRKQQAPPPRGWTTRCNSAR